VSTYGYDQAGRVASRTDPGGLSWERTYEPATGLVSSQVITGPSGQLARFALGYDQAANVTSRTEIVAAPEGGSTPGSGTWSYAYDGPGRMISATDPDGQITTYGYDNAGNRTSVKVGSAPAVTTSYDAAGLATSSSDGTVFANDEVGSLTGVDAPGTDQDRCYFYDGFGMLYSTASGISSGCSRNVADIVYYSDSLGRVTQREDSRSVEEDGSGITGELSFYEGKSSDLVALASSTDYVPGEVSEYAYSLSGPFAYASGTGQGYFLNDLHGDVVGQTDASAAIAGSKLYSPWGEPTAQLGESSALGYQGQPTDADTGLVKTETRWLSPSMGRFQTRDVLFGDTNSPPSLNQFGYAQGNPVTLSDPSGMVVNDSRWKSGKVSITAGGTQFTVWLSARAHKEGGPVHDHKFIAQGKIWFTANASKVNSWGLTTEIQRARTDNWQWMTLNTSSPCWSTSSGTGCNKHGVPTSFGSATIASTSFILDGTSHTCAREYGNGYRWRSHVYDPTVNGVTANVNIDSLQIC